MTAEQRAEYARELERLKAELIAMDIPRDAAKTQTLACMDGALRDLAALA